MTDGELLCQCSFENNDCFGWNAGLCIEDVVDVEWTDDALLVELRCEVMIVDLSDANLGLW